MRGHQVPNRLAIRFHEELHHLFGFALRERQLVGLFQVFAAIFRKHVVQHHTSGIVDGIVQRANRHIRHAGIEYAMGAVPTNEVRQIRHRAGANRLMPGVTRLAASNRVLHIDDTQKTQLIAQGGAGVFFRRETQEEAVGAFDIAAHGGDGVLVQPFFKRTRLHDRLLVFIPHHRAVVRRRHFKALHHGVAARVFGE